VKVHDFGIVIYGVWGGIKKVKFFDFFAEHPHDFEYTIFVWQKFFQSYELQLDKLEELNIWGDTVLRTKENLFYFC
jgi:hypothetical protein